MEAQDVPIFDGVGDGVGVQTLLEKIFRGLHGGLRVLDLLLRGVFLKDRRAGKAEQLGLGGRSL